MFIYKSCLHRLTTHVVRNPMRILSNSMHMEMDAFPLVGLDLGYPLNLITNLFTTLHYDYDITTSKIIILQFLIGYYSYGKDRYKDALEYRDTLVNDSFNETTSTALVISPEKETLYKSLLKYPSIYRFSYCMSFYTIAWLVCCDNIQQGLPILALLYSTEYYKTLKTYASFLKPFYVSFMWTFATIIMPCVLYEHSYDILNDFYDYVPCFLVLFATTNVADVKDMEEDALNGVQTLPLIVGETTTKQIIFGSLALSSLLFGLHPHYMNRPIINSLFELQNAILAIVVYLKIQSPKN